MVRTKDGEALEVLLLVSGDSRKRLKGERCVS